MKLSVATQPIVTLGAQAEVVGYEALLRSSRPPDEVFRAAERAHRVPALELAMLAESLPLAPTLGALLFVNAHPTALDDTQYAQTFLEIADEHLVDPYALVVEITEQAPITRPAVALRNVDRLRERGVRFAIDDLGTGYPHLSWLADIAPSYVKISHAIGRSFERNPYAARTVRLMAQFAAESECATILEGIETATTAAAAAQLGIAYGQGYYFGRPELHAPPQAETEELPGYAFCTMGSPWLRTFRTTNAPR